MIKLLAIFASLWIQNGAPIITATQPWEANAVYEPTVLKIPSGYRMWYTGGWETPGTGTATSKDGIHWTKYAENPIIDGSDRNTVLKVGKQFWLYRSNNVNDIWLSTSNDGIHFTDRGRVFTHPPWATNVANSSVIREAPNRWVMFFDAGMTSPYGYKMGLARSTDGIHWVDSGAPLNLGAQYPTVGAPMLQKVGKVYQLWFLAGGTSENGVLPTDVFYSQSTNLIDWTTPRLLVGRTQSWEVDQTADPWKINNFLYFAGCDNANAFCAIGVATKS